MKNSGPLIAALVLLLCVPVYFVSYLALVVPAGAEFNYYRLAPDQAAVVYWPMEQVDRRIRPAAWEDSWRDIGGPGSISGFETSCTFGADEMTTEASFFEEPEGAESFDSNPFDDVP